MRWNAGWVRSVAVGATVAAAACGGSNSSNSLPPGYYISISNMAFSPPNLAAPPGATVTVINNDTILHSVTSETTLGAFTPGAVSGVSFDTGQFSGPGAMRSFTIPSNAPNGTAVPYYCSFHKGAMATPNGIVTVTVGAPPNGGGGGGGGGGY